MGGTEPLRLTHVALWWGPLALWLMRPRGESTDVPQFNTGSTELGVLRAWCPGRPPPPAPRELVWPDVRPGAACSVDRPCRCSHRGLGEIGPQWLCPLPTLSWVS